MYPDPRLIEFDGRTLTVEDAGPPGGFPVLVHCGAGSRHLEPSAVRAAHRHGLRAADYHASVHRDGWTRGDEGWWDDWSAFLSPWDFELDAIAAPVSLWHGLADERCPPAHGRWLAERIPHVTAHFPEDEDHTSIEENNRSAAYAWILAQIN